MDRQHGAAERDRVAVLEGAIDLDRVELRARSAAEPEITATAGLQQILVALVDQYLRAGHPLQLGQARDMIVMTMRRGENLRVGDLEPELGGAGGDLLRGVAHPRVDQDVALRRDDEVGGQVVAADPVDVADDAERREGPRPLVVLAAARCGACAGICSRPYRGWLLLRAHSPRQRHHHRRSRHHSSHRHLPAKARACRSFLARGTFRPIAMRRPGPPTARRRFVRGFRAPDICASATRTAAV